jgi:hypothetical protein
LSIHDDVERRRVANSPHDEAELVPLSLTLVVLQVVDSPSALLLGQLLDESLPLLTLLQGGLLNGGDALRVGSDSVDDELVLLAELELVVGLEAGLVLATRWYRISSRLQG